jgi:YcaO-like protein with predicted kinase domain
VATAIRPNSRSVSVSLGKGISLVQAMTSAVMEAAENFHGEQLADRYHTATYRALAARAAVAAPDSLPRTRSRFDGGTAIPWIEGFDLLHRESCWLPAELVHTDCTIPPLPGSGHFLSSSNGLAAGNHVLEALISAICEVIERDAVALWKAKGIRARARHVVDAASVADADCRGLLKKYAAADMAVRIWHVTTEPGVPAFICDIRPRAEAMEPLTRRFRGAACHPDPAVALAGALTEAAQTRLTYISGARDDLPPEDYIDPPTASLSETLLDAFAGEATARDFATIPGFPARDLAQTVRTLLDRLVRGGWDRVVAVDLSLPDRGIPVVRVVIPGMESPADDPRYRPGARARAAAEAS